LEIPVCRDLSKNLAIKEERAVKTPNPNIPALKLQWSAMSPKIKGALPDPKITPMAMMNPKVMDLSEMEVNFEIPIKATGKNARERRACRIRVAKIAETVEDKARPTVLSPVAKMLHLRMA
jgi:hypothetical protein